MCYCTGMSEPKLDPNTSHFMAREALAAIHGHCSEGYDTAVYEVQDAIERAFALGFAAAKAAQDGDRR